MTFFKHIFHNCHFYKICKLFLDAATNLHNLGTLCAGTILKMDPQWRMIQLAGILAKIDQNVQNNKGCQIWSSNFAVNQRERGFYRGPKYGRLKVRWPDGRTKFYLAHRFMWMLHHDTIVVPVGMHVSHTCHMSLCVNPMHLSLEPAYINNERQICKNFIPPRCQHHDVYPDCIL